MIIWPWITLALGHLMSITCNVFDTIWNVFESLIFVLSIFVTIVGALVNFLKVTISFSLEIKWVLCLFVWLIYEEPVSYWCLSLSYVWWLLLRDDFGCQVVMISSLKLWKWITALHVLSQQMWLLSFDSRWAFQIRFHFRLLLFKFTNRLIN